MSTAPQPGADSGDLDAFAFLLTGDGQELLASLRDFAPGDELAAATRLRRAHPAEVVAEAITQAGLRRRAAGKFGADAARMYFTPDGVEQATRAGVAAHRARRFRELGVRRVADLCGGIGGDAIALARAGVEVLAVDRSPRTCAVAEANAAALGLADRITVRCDDVAGVDLAGFDAVFVDPARRGGRGRIFDPEAYSPPLSWAVGAARRVPYAALKVAPGIPHEAVPGDAEAEWVSEGGDVKEAVLWFGTAPGARRATLLPSGAAAGRGTGARDDGPVAYGVNGVNGAHGVNGAYGAYGASGPDADGTEVGAPGATPTSTEYPRALTGITPTGITPTGITPTGITPTGVTLTGTGLPDPPAGPVRRYLYEPDGAVIRAHLVAEVAGAVGGTLIDATIAYVTSDELVATPFAHAYAISDVLPFNLKRLKALLREREVGTLTVKKRGSAVEPEEVRRRVRPRGPNAATVLLTRVAGAPAMLIGAPA